MLTQQQLIERMQILLKDTLSPFGLYPEAQPLNKLHLMKLGPLNDTNKMQPLQNMHSIEVQTYTNSGHHSPHLANAKSKSGYQSVFCLNKYAYKKRTRNTQ